MKPSCAPCGRVAAGPRFPLPPDPAMDAPREIGGARMAGTLIDLSHAIVAGMTTYKGLPGPLICDYLSREQSAGHYDDGATFQIGRIDMVANTGTYLDVPSHRFEAGDDLAR